MSMPNVLAAIREYGCPLVEITGGEPLLQEAVYELMSRLVDGGYTVLIETGGHISTARVPAAVIKILDVKCPGSGEAARNDWTNLDRLTPQDEVKFVIADRADYEFACEATIRRGLADRAAAVLFSPVHGVLDPKVLSEWILEDRLPVRLQLQLHKYIWGPGVRGV